MSDLSHIGRIRQELPATTVRIYLNTGTFGPLPTHAVQVMQQHMQRDLQDGRLGPTFFDGMRESYDAARQAVARLIHAHDDEIALTDNTGEGLNIICYGLDWQPGDEIITTNHEHISLLAPLYQLRARYGVALKQVDLGPQAARPVREAMAELLTERTRLLALSHVTYTTGTRLDVGTVSALGREHNIPVLVDGAQSAGVIPLDMQASGVDFYAIPGQKWLCGPDGTGALYVNREALRYVTSTYVGYFSATEEDMHGDAWKPQPNARRFELGGRQTAAVAAQAAALNWLEETVDHAWLFARIAELHTYAYHALQTVPGLVLLTPQPAHSGLLTFTLAEHNAEEVVNYLREQHHIDTRTIPDTNALRISTGFYNTEAEIDTLVRALQTYRPVE